MNTRKKMCSKGVIEMTEVSLTGKKFNKKRIEILTEAFEILEGVHEEVAASSYHKTADYGRIPDAANEIFDLLDKLYVDFGFAKRTLEQIEEDEQNNKTY